MQRPAERYPNTDYYTLGGTRELKRKRLKVKLISDITVLCTVLILIPLYVFYSKCHHAFFTRTKIFQSLRETERVPSRL